MQEEVAGVGKETVVGAKAVRCGDARGIVADAVIFVQDDRHHEHPEVAFRVIELPWIRIEPVQVPFGLGLHMLNPLVEPGETILNPDVFRAGQAFGAEQVQQCNVALVH